VEKQRNRNAKAEQTRAKMADATLGGTQAMRDLAGWLTELPGVAEVLLADQIKRSGLTPEQYKAQLRQARERERQLTEGMRRIRQRGREVQEELDRQQRLHPQGLT
jgi:hypothetical protein